VLEAQQLSDLLTGAGTQDDPYLIYGQISRGTIHQLQQPLIPLEVIIINKRFITWIFLQNR
jgi:hypothetical protein